MAESDIIQHFLDALETGDLDQCLKNIEQLWDCKTISSQIWVKMGDVLRRKALETDQTELKKDYAQKALIALKRGCEVDPQNAMAWLRLGHFYLYYLDAFDAAIEAFKPAFQQYRMNWQYNLALGQAYLGKQTKNDYEKAVQYLILAHQLAPNELDPIYHGIKALFHLKNIGQTEQPNQPPQYQEIIDLYSLIIEQFPEEQDIINELDPIINHITQALLFYLRKHENDEKCWLDLGILHYYQNKIGEAKVAFNNAIEINPGIENAWFFLGNIFWTNEKNLEQAQSALEKVIALNPKHTLAWFLLGDIAQSQNKSEEAQYYYQQSYLLNPAKPISPNYSMKVGSSIGKNEDNTIKKELSQELRISPRILLYVNQTSPNDEHSNLEIDVEIQGDKKLLSNSAMEQLLTALEPAIHKLSGQSEFQDIILPLEIHLMKNLKINE